MKQKMSERFRRGSLLSDSGILISANAIGDVFNYIFHVYIGRALGPASYGIFGSIVSLLYITSVPAQTIQTTIGGLTSEFMAEGEKGKIKSLLFGGIKRVSFYGAVGCALVMMLSGVIASYLHLPTKAPAILLGVMVFASILYPIPRGILQGIQRFFHLGISVIAGATSKLLFAVLLVSLGFGVNGALSSLILSNVVVFAVILFFLRGFVHEERSRVDKLEVYKYSFPVLVATFFLTLISNIDMVLVKHFLNPVEAGYYAAASLLAKVIFFVSTSIVFAMFPKAIKEHSLTGRSSSFLREGLLYVLIISSIGVGLYFLAPEIIISLMFGRQYIPVAAILGLLGIALALFSLSNVVIMYDIAVKEMKFLYFLIFSTFVELILILIFHQNLYTIVWIVITTMAFLFASLIIMHMGVLTEGVLGEF